MGIDERLDRLTERHEALTQTVELLAHEISGLKEAAIALLEVATSHERRISNLEDKP